MSSNVQSTGATAEAAPSWLDQLRKNPRLPLMVGASAAIAAIAALWLWNRTPDYGVLYSNLSDRDGGAIIASLQQMNIPYKFAEGGGALLVAANKVPEARLRLASQGLPKGGTVGFELMDNQKFGTSQFAEQVNYQRSLEGELARSINSMSAVESSRIHLALPKPSLFVRDQKKPSASVMLTLHRGRSIDEGQVSAIIHMVSSSVPELSSKNITVVDQAGRLLSAANASMGGLDVSQLKYAQEIEQGYSRRIEAILQPILGTSNVRAQVAADIDFSVVENTDEKYRPNQEHGTATIRSQQSSDSSQQGAGSIGGVPGALSNQPPPDATAPVAAQDTTQQKPGAANQLKMSTELGAASAGVRSSGANNLRKDGTTNYEVDRSIRHTQQGAGGIKRLSVAVVVNYRSTEGAAGKRVTQALTPAELEQIKNLVKESMGFNAARGDTLNVVNSLFTSDATDAPELPWWRQPDNIGLAKELGKYLLLVMLGLFAWFAVIRPLLRQHLYLAKTGAQSAALVQAHAADPLAPGHPASPEEAKRQEENVKFARQQAIDDPRMVAMVIKHWLGKNVS